MARDPVGHRLALAKRLRLKIKELKAEIRLRGTEKVSSRMLTYAGVC